MKLRYHLQSFALIARLLERGTRKTWWAVHLTVSSGLIESDECLDAFWLYNFVCIYGRSVVDHGGNLNHHFSELAPVNLDLIDMFLVPIAATATATAERFF